MTSTNIYVGLAEGGKSCINKVPNAPRGCIGEIFGDGAHNGVVAPSSSGPETSSRPRDTHSRLFGGPQARAAPAPIANGNGNSHGHGHHEAAPTNGHHGHANQINGHAKEGNPITGDGYKSMNGEINTYVAPLNGNATPINHNRVPPGGYSSGLW